MGEGVLYNLIFTEFPFKTVSETSLRFTELVLTIPVKQQQQQQQHQQQQHQPQLKVPANPQSAEMFLYLFLYFFQFDIIINDLVSSFRLFLIFMLWVYGHYKYFNSISLGTVFIRQNLTSTDVRF